MNLTCGSPMLAYISWSSNNRLLKFVWLGTTSFGQALKHFVLSGTDQVTIDCDL
jgi:hypothetical protein